MGGVENDGLDAVLSKRAGGRKTGRSRADDGDVDVLWKVGQHAKPMGIPSLARLEAARSVTGVVARMYQP